MDKLSESVSVDEIREEDVLPSNQLTAISEYTFVTKYARYDAKKKRRETWDETVDRVRDMHLQRYGNKGIEEDIKWAFECVRRKEVLPSMRSMQFGGEAIIANDARMYNCAYTHADRPRFFSEAFWMLLSGVGVGFSVQKQHVAKLPKLIDHRSPNEKEIFTYVVGDTVEGWADALDVLMSTYFQGSPNSGREVFFDFSRIRRKGTWLKTSGGRAPGADPLRIALKRIKQVLRSAVEARQEQLRPIQVYDIAMMAADAVISGGIRRSATIAIFSHDDTEMMTAKSFFASDGMVLSNKRKDGTWLTEHGVAWNLKLKGGSEPQAGDRCDIGWFNTMPWRGRSNNSVALLRDECTKEQFKEIISNARKFGEPGFVFLDNLDYGYNPCVEIGLNPVDIHTGEVGWQVCNLTEINGGKILNKEDFRRAVRAATIIGTLQAGYTYFHYLTDVSRRIIRRERLLGVSVTGWMENPDVSLQPELQREMAQYAVEVNREFSAKIGIEPAARVTCTKPSGNSSLILGTSSGIHPHHYYRYFRRVQGSSTEQPLQFFKLFNPQAVESSVWSQQGEVKGEVITFCVEVPKSAMVKDDLGAIEFLKIVKSTYENWVLPGTAIPESSPGLTHNVSNTVKVAPDEWDAVSDFIYENRQCFSGISLIPAAGDKIYQQAPLEKIESPEDIKKWNELVKNYNSIDWAQFSENEDYTQLLGEAACAGGACSV